jgi:hypothetical protein
MTIDVAQLDESWKVCGTAIQATSEWEQKTKSVARDERSQKNARSKPRPTSGVESLKTRGTTAQEPKTPEISLRGFGLPFKTGFGWTAVLPSG